MEELAEIERVFAHLKDRIYSEKLRRVEIEMKMIQDGTHPEYVAQKACIDQKLDEKERLADAQYKNGMESLEIATRVTKAQVHSQYYQRVRELRENTLNKCSELWYHIQRERRAGDTLVSEYTYRIPDRASTRIQHRRQYNWEVALLTGISKHVGFPAAPDVLGASEEERAEDLEAIGIAPRVPVRASATVQPPVLRDRLLDDHYERPQPIHWSQVQRHSPPSPAPQPVQAHSHPHVHIHHHHNRRHAASGVSNQPDQPLFLKQRVPSAAGSANPSHSQPSNVPLSALLQNDIKQEHSSPRPPSSLALSIHGGNNQNRSPQLVHNHPQSHPSQRPLQYNYSGHPMPSHPLQPPPHQHHSLYARSSSIESHPAPPPAQRIIDLGSPAPGERIYGREVEAPDGGLKRLKEESDGSLGMPTATMRFPSRMSGF
ncbi:hypothetical protein P167DRAFT_7664 [Morchella conica CCBAS932]|uniref:Uncharacterized protein n=3 Tax=Morchella sect. Distantes TaxID=1051054 RepID=A0A3N4LAM1_9PEZI|nr:hypothetical protein P167DRAFT_7664 [Morchella conica CCBAS932]